MMNYLPLCVVVLSVMVFDFVKGDCLIGTVFCGRSFFGTDMSTPEAFCKRLSDYKGCVTDTCGDAKQIGALMKTALSLTDFTCGSTMLYVSALHVMLVAIASVFFNAAT